MKLLQLKLQEFGDRRKAMLEDIATLTGGVVISEELGYDLKEADITMLGRAGSVKVTKEGHYNSRWIWR